MKIEEVSSRITAISSLGRIMPDRKNNPSKNSENFSSVLNKERSKNRKAMSR